MLSTVYCLWWIWHTWCFRVDSAPTVRWLVVITNKYVIILVLFCISANGWDETPYIL